MIHFFLSGTQYNVEFLTLSKNHQAIQTHHSTLELLVSFYYFLLLSYIFPRVINGYVSTSSMFVRAS